MKARIVHLYEIVAGFILSLLGFTGCERIVNTRVEYGMPHADYILQGQVKDADTDQGIEGLKITYGRHMYTDENGEKHYSRQEFKSGKNGEVNVALDDYQLDEPTDIILEIEDVDGEKNGLYDTQILNRKDLEITYKKEEKPRWKMGTYTISFLARMTEYSDIICEYGVPHATYKVEGTVTDPDGAPIPGIEVLALLWNQAWESDGGEFLPVGYTDQEGRFHLEGTSWPGATEIRVECKDVDGEANGGQFENANGEAAFTRQAEGNGNWDEGTFGASLDIRLNKAE